MRSFERLSEHSKLQKEQVEQMELDDFSSEDFDDDSTSDMRAKPSPVAASSAPSLSAVKVPMMSGRWDESSDDDDGDDIDAADPETKRALQALGLHGTGSETHSSARAGAAEASDSVQNVEKCHAGNAEGLAHPCPAELEAGPDPSPAELPSVEDPGAAFDDAVRKANTAIAHMKAAGGGVYGYEQRPEPQPKSQSGANVDVEVEADADAAVEVEAVADAAASAEAHAGPGPRVDMEPKAEAEAMAAEAEEEAAQEGEAEGEAETEVEAEADAEVGAEAEAHVEDVRGVDAVAVPEQMDADADAEQDAEQAEDLNAVRLASTNDSPSDRQSDAEGNAGGSVIRCLRTSSNSGVDLKVGQGSLDHVGVLSQSLAEAIASRQNSATGGERPADANGDIAARTASDAADVAAGVICSGWLQQKPHSAAVGIGRL